MKKKIVILMFLLAVFGYLAFTGKNTWYHIYKRKTDKRTVAEVIDMYGPAAENRLIRSFESAGVSFPPQKIALLAVKENKMLELWAKDGEKWSLIKHYQILGASSVWGPKKREGDMQVPEGIYSIVGLNPNSSYHLSMKLNYPNDFDKFWAIKEGRTNPGSDIFIHGKTASVGCLAMGDPAIEELFHPVHRTGKENSIVIIAPQDPRVKPLVPPEGSPPWVSELYNNIKSAFLLVAET